MIEQQHTTRWDKRSCSAYRVCWGSFKSESGVHRVQRVPETESGGRIHTSAATVAVLPEAEDVEIEISSNDLRIDTMRSSGAVGSTNTRFSCTNYTFTYWYSSYKF